MAKINIIFNDTNYTIDEASLSTASAALKAHLSNVMNGSGAVINLDGVAYNIDSTKLSAATSDFVNHLGKIAGTGHKVMIGGVEYTVDSAKVQGAVKDIGSILDSFNTGKDVLAPGLYETGAIALYKSGDVEAASGMLKTSWDDLVANGVIAVGEGAKLPEGAELNDYGFYYGVKYTASFEGMTMSFVFNEDGSAVANSGGEIMDIPAGTIIYGDHVIDMSALGFPVCIVSEDGSSFDGQGIVFYASEDPKLPEGAELNEYGFCYGIAYSQTDEGVTASFVFNEDGSAVFSVGGEITDIPAGTIIYGDHVIDMSALGFPIGTVSEDGIDIDFGEGMVLSADATNTRPKGAIYFPKPSIIEGDLVIINDGSTICFEPFAFSSKTSLTGIAIPASVTSIGAYAFANCTGLTDITIPDGVTSIGKNAFRGCTSLTDVTIGNGVTIIGDYMFEDCASLTNITIGNGVTSIGGSAFRGCTSLTSIIIPDNVTSIVWAFKDCTGLTNVVIGNGVTSIGESAFQGCTNLTDVTIPDSVTSIGRNAFEGCSSLTDITIPDSVTSIGGNAFARCTNLTSITIPDSVTCIDNFAFTDCTSLTSVAIPDGIASIGVYMFEGCTSLTDVTIPDSVTYIDDYAFRYCSNLTDITIPDGVTSIGESAFEGCTSLTDVTIPDSVTSIGKNAFKGCSNLTDIVIGNGVTSIGYGAFQNCTNLTSITISDSVTTIGYYAFDGCPIRKLIIADGSKTMGQISRIGQKTVQEIIIPDSFTSISNSAFSGYSSNLINVTIGNGVTSIGDSAFNNCTSLTNVTIGNSVSSIGRGAFYQCTNLTHITIPDSVTSIGGNAFYGCTGLKSVTFAGTNTQWNAIEKGQFWKYGVPATYVQCSNCQVAI